MTALTVLLVGDDLTTETALADALGEERFGVLTASDGETALRLLGQRPVAVVLAEETLPDMDGLTLWHEIARRSLDTRVILVSDHPIAEAVRAALVAGIYEHVAWPTDDVSGLVALIHRAAHEFTLLQRNRVLMQQLQAEIARDDAGPSGAAIEGQQLLELDVLRALSSELSTLHDVAHILHVADRHLPRLFDYALLLVLVKDLEETQVFLFPRGHPDSAFVEAGVENLLTLHSMFTGQPHTRDEVQIQRVDETAPASTFSHFAAAGSELRSHITFPLVAGGETIGSLSLASPVAGAFSASDVQVFSLITYQLASAIYNAQLFRRTQEMAITDALTGLYNRRHFEEVLDHEYLRAQRYGHPLSLAIIDLDHFKRINDTLGHLAGDMVLQQISRLLRESVRHVDVVSRYGGEEFTLLLPNTSLEEAAVLAERLRLTVQGRTFVTSQHRVNITISSGVATLGEDVPTKEMLIQHADEALLLAKSQGRNRVCLHVPHGGVVEARQMGLRERRRFPRARVRLPIRYVPLSEEEARALLGVSRDVSIEGIAFSGEEPLPPGNFALLDLTLPAAEAEEEVRALAQVVWARETEGAEQAVMGARLIPLSSEARQRIAELVDQTGVEESREKGKGIKE